MLIMLKTMREVYIKDEKKKKEGKKAVWYQSAFSQISEGTTNKILTFVLCSMLVLLLRPHHHSNHLSFPN